MKDILLRGIRLYQAITRSGVATPFLLPAYSGCRSWPTCSEYAYSVIENHGVVIGTMKAVRRFAGCHSFFVAQQTHST